MNTESAPPDTAHSTLSQSPGKKILKELLIVFTSAGYGAEGGVLRQPGQINGTCLALAVFQNDSLRLIGVFTFLIIIPVTVQTYNNVRVLLDSAGFTQVGEHGALVGTGLIGAAELGKADHRNIQLFGHDLEHTADVADGLCTALV